MPKKNSVETLASSFALKCIKKSLVYFFLEANPTLSKCGFELKMRENCLQKVLEEIIGVIIIGNYCCSCVASRHTVRNLHFLSKNSTLISQENCRFFFGWKTCENVVVLDFLAVDNFDFTRKIAKQILAEKLVKML